MEFIENISNKFMGAMKISVEWWNIYVCTHVFRIYNLKYPEDMLVT